MSAPRTFDEFFISEFEIPGSPVSREDGYRIWQAAIKFQAALPADVAGIVKRMGDCELHSNPFSAVANPPYVKVPLPLYDGIKSTIESLAGQVADMTAKHDALLGRLNPSIECVEGTPVGYGEDEIDRLEEKLAAKGEEIKALRGQRQVIRAALQRLTFHARTSGGTAGRDDAMCAACDEAEGALLAVEDAIRNEQGVVLP